MGAVTLLSRIFGYVRDLLQAAFLGAADLSDAYVVALRIPNLFRRLVGEGAMTAAFIPVFAETRQQEGEKAAWRFAAAAFWTLATVLAALVSLGILFTPGLVKVLAFGFSETSGKVALTVGLTRLMFPYLLFIGLAALVMALLNSIGRFAVPAFTPVLLNLSIIFFALVYARQSENPAFWFGVGVLVGGALQLGFQLPFLRGHPIPLRPRLGFSDRRVRQVGRLMLPGLFGVGVTQLNLIVDSQVASFLGSGSVSYLYYAVRVEELVLGVFVISFSTVILPALSRYSAEGRDDLIRSSLSRALRFVTFVTVPASVGLWVLRVPIISTLFQRGEFGVQDTLSTSSALALYGLGLLPNGLVKILAPAFYARLDTRTPVRVGAVAFVLHVPLSIGLGWWLGHAGIALSTSLAAATNGLLLLGILVRREGGAWARPLLGAAGRIALAAAMMGVALLAVLNWRAFDAAAGLPDRALMLGGLIALGAAVFLVSARLCGAREGGQLWRELRGRLESSAPAGR